MGKMILIFGPNSSGKSRFAEELAAKTRGDRYYIATMIPQAEENLRRIEKHRKQRAGLGFTTLELPYQVMQADVTADSVVLLEDAANLLANSIFERNGDSAQVCQEICALTERCRLLIVVTISGLRADGYTGETAAYIDAVNRLNCELLDKSAAAAELMDGVPVWRKGDIHVVD